MLREILSELNLRKLQERSFKDVLEKLEKLLNNLSIFEKSQVCLFLASDYLYIGSYEKVSLYVNMALEIIHECFKKNILDHSDIILFAENISKSHVIIISSILEKNETDIKPILIDYFKKLINSDDYFYIMKNSTEIVNFLIKKINTEDEKLYLFLIILDFIETKEHLEALFSIYFSLDIKLVPFEEKFISLLKEFNGYKIYYQIFLAPNDVNFIKISEAIISRKNDYQDMDILILNSLKTKKYEVLNGIFTEIEKMIGKNNLNYIYYKCLFFKISELTYENASDKIKKMSIPIEKIDYIKNDYISFLVSKKRYYEVLQLLPNRSISFMCHVKIGNMPEAEKIFEEELKIKYSLGTNNKLEIEEESKIRENDIFLFYIKLNDNTSALNIIRKIKSQCSYISCLQIAYENQKLELLKECIIISIEKFKIKNFKIMKIIISYIHVNELIPIFEERLGILYTVLKDFDFNNYTDDENKWFVDICYNNAIDCIFNKSRAVWKMLEISLKILNNLNLDIIEITLNAYLKNIEFIKNEKLEMLKIDSLVLYYANTKKKYLLLTIMFYELTGDIQFTGMLKPIKKICDKNILRLLNINNNNFNFRLDLYKECENRNILKIEKVEIILREIAYYGPLFLYEFISKINLYKYYNSNIELILIKQLEFLEIINNQILEQKFKAMIKKLNKK